MSNKFTVTTGNKHTAELNRLTRTIMCMIYGTGSITTQLAACSKSTRV